MYLYLLGPAKKTGRILYNDAEGLRFLDRIAHIGPLNLNFGDEMSCDWIRKASIKRWVGLLLEISADVIN